MPNSGLRIHHKSLRNMKLIQAKGSTRLLSLLLLALFRISDTWGATAFNAKSPLGMNLAGVTYYSSEQPFLNIFKTSAVTQANPTPWVTGSSTTSDTGEEAYLQLDTNGYPTTLAASAADPNHPQLYDRVGVLLLFNLSNSNAGQGLPFRTGQYVVLYDGKGTLRYWVPGGSVVSQSPGRDVVNITTPTGLGINLYATDPDNNGNYIRNIRVVYATEESLLKGGGVFRPAFLSLLQNFRVLRFMDWLSTNNSPLTTWSTRPQIADAGWASPRGVPLEVAVQLCNAVGADCWLNVPHQADDDYITQMAVLVHRNLGTKQSAYVEFSNEVWNSIFKQSAYAAAQGQMMWPNSGLGSYEIGLNWFGMRTARMCDIWRTAWGADSSRLHCVLGAQLANAWTATTSLICSLWVGQGHAPCSAHNITDVAVAPYFGFEFPASWASLDPATQLNNLFTELTQGGLVANDYLGGALRQIADREASFAAALVPYHLPFLAYEGGQSFRAFPTYANGSWAVSLTTATNRDPRMGDAYAKALSDWKTNGGRIFNQFVDIGGPNQYGAWGALEGFLDTVIPLANAPVKWQALQKFIANNACWWPGCVGTISAGVPMPPTGLTAH